MRQFHHRHTRNGYGRAAAVFAVPVPALQGECVYPHWVASGGQARGDSPVTVRYALAQRRQEVAFTSLTR